MLAWLIRVPSSTATVKVAEAGLGSSGSVTAMIAVFAAAAASVKTLVTAASLLCGVPIPAGSGVRSTSRAARAPGEGSDIGVDQVGDAVEDDQDRARAGLLAGEQRHRVLVAALLRPLVAHAADPGRRGLAEVIALAGRLGAAGQAVEVGPDLSPAVAARPAARVGQRVGQRVAPVAGSGALIGASPRSSDGTIVGGVSGSTASPICAPHDSQKRAPAGTPTPHEGHAVPARWSAVVGSVMSGSSSVRRSPG